MTLYNEDEQEQVQLPDDGRVCQHLQQRHHQAHSLEDANFSWELADAALMGLYTELKWVEENFGGLRGEGEEANFMDKVFDNSMNRLVDETDAAFVEMRFRDGLKSGWFEFVSARNVYHDWCAVS